MSDEFLNIVFENGMGRVEGPLMPVPNGEEIFVVGEGSTDTGELIVTPVVTSCTNQLCISIYS